MDKRSISYFLSLISVLALGGCAISQNNLGASEWVLERIQGKVLDKAYSPTLSLSKDGKVSGFAGCNRFGGSFSEQDGQLTFSKLFSTRRACAQEKMELEQRYLSVLGQVTDFQVNENELVLTTEGSEKLFFKRALKEK